MSRNSLEAKKIFEWRLWDSRAKIVTAASGSGTGLVKIDVPGQPSVYKSYSEINGKTVEEYWMIEDGKR